MLEDACRLAQRRSADTQPREELLLRTEKHPLFVEAEDLLSERGGDRLCRRRSGLRLPRDHHAPRLFGARRVGDGIRARCCEQNERTPGRMRPGVPSLINAAWSGSAGHSPLMMKSSDAWTNSPSSIFTMKAPTGSFDGSFGNTVVGTIVPLELLDGLGGREHRFPCHLARLGRFLDDFPCQQEVIVLRRNGSELVDVLLAERLHDRLNLLVRVIERIRNEHHVGPLPGWGWPSDSPGRRYWDPRST